MSSQTLAQRTNFDGFPKPGELIEITGCHELEASDRILLNTLYQHAHDSGKLAKEGSEWELSYTRLRHSKHESNDRLSQSIGCTKGSLSPRYATELRFAEPLLELH